MESLYSSLIMFSGATITMLGVCLVISERQLRKKQRELNEYKRKHGANPTKSSTASEHLETSSSSGRLDEYKTKPSELLSVQSDHKRLEETIASQKNEFQKSEAEREQLLCQIQETDSHRAVLQSEIAALKQQLAEKEVTVNSLQSAAQQGAQRQSEYQLLFGEKQCLEEEIVRYREQLRRNEEQLHEAMTQYRAIAEQHAQLESDLANSNQRSVGLDEKNNELLEEVGRLSTKLRASEKKFDELRTIQENAGLEKQQLCETNQQLHRELMNVRAQLAMTQSQTDTYAERNQTLQNETAELRQELEQHKTSLDELQKSERRYREIHSESQELRMQNQALQQELENQRLELNAREVRLQRAANENQGLSDRCVQLETEMTDWKQRLEESQSKIRDLQIAQQQLANVESREMIYRGQDRKLEAQIDDLERELSEANKQKTSQKTETDFRELQDENRRLRMQIAQWRERLFVGEENQKEASSLSQQRGESRLVDETRQTQNTIITNDTIVENVSHFPSDSSETTLLHGTGTDTADLSSGPNDSNEKRSNQKDDGSRGSAAATRVPNDVKPGSLSRSSVERKWHFRTAPAVVVVLIASAIVVGLLGTQSRTQSLTSNKPAVMPEVSSHEFAADEDPKAPPKPAPRLQGIFETTRSTQVYGAPSKNAPVVGNIGPGTKLNVVDSSDGWLEIRSKHGRPPGFVRQDAAVRIGQK